MHLTHAGITSAVFSFTQCLTAIAWGRSSDYFGRKSIILIGLSMTMIMSVIWGLSTSLPMAILARALSGGGNGNVGILRTMVAEMVPEKILQPRAFSVMPLVWSIGSVLGPAFGGFFAKPAVNLPGLFGNSKLFIKFPFLLPNLVAAAIFLLGITVGFLFLHETLETRKHQKDYGIILGKKLTRCVTRKRNEERNPDYDDDELGAALLHGNHSRDNSFSAMSHKTNRPINLAPPSIKECFTRQSSINLLCYTLLALHSMSFDQLLPIFMHLPRSTTEPESLLKFTGGFGISSSRIGTLFTLYGITAGLVQFFVFPPVVRRFGVLRSYKVCSIIIPTVMFATPYTALIKNEILQQGAMFGIMAVKAFVGIFMFPCSTIMLTNSAGSLRLLGTLNGVATSTSAVGRGMGPFMAGAAFTWGLERGYVIVAWWMLGCIAILGAIPIFFLEEMDGFNKTPDDEESDSEDDIVYIDDDAGAIIDGDEAVSDDENQRHIHTVESGSFDRDHRLGVASVQKRVSSPVGLRGSSLGPGERGRRLSTNLGYSNVGSGTGGTTFN